MSELIAKISQLTITERILLVQEILNTISIENEGGLTSIQKEEIDRRSESIKNGTAKTVPWENIEATLIKRYDL